jgi:HlyD family secretion protein
MPRPQRRQIIAITIAALALATAAWWWSARNDSKPVFRSATVKRGDLAATISATGTIEPEEVVDVGAQVAGQITSFGADKNGRTIDYGSVVAQGSVLAKIDESVYASDVALGEAQLDQDKAAELSAAGNLDQMKAKSVQAQADWERAQKLGPSEALASTLYDSYKATYEIALANVKVAEGAAAQARASTVQAGAMLDKARRNLDFCTITSPVDGVIIDRRVNIGETVVSSLNTPSLFLIAKDLTRMQIWVSVNEADIGRIIPGAPVTFTCDAFPGRQFNGAVGKVRLNASMTQNVVMYTVEVNTANPDNTLLPYLTANVQFVVQKESNTLIVPNAALRWSPTSLAEISPGARSSIENDPSGDPTPSTPQKSSAGRSGVIWLQDGDFVRPVEVKAGVSDGVSTAVSANGLQEGQTVVISEDAQSAQSGTENPFLPRIIRR